jgi:hypothetical protein
MTATPLTIIMQFCIIIGVFISVYLFYKYVDKIKAAPCKADIIKSYLSLERESMYNKEIAGILVRLKIELQSCKVGLMRFHNGGKFANGLDMKKFTATHETASDIVPPFMDKCVGVLNSRYPVAFEMLATQGTFVTSDVDDCIDLNFKADMKKFGFKACYLFLINQVDGTHEGFIGINFTKTEVLSAEKRHIVKEEIPKILSLINMVE